MRFYKPVRGGADLPSLNNPASGENILDGFEAIDGTGKKVTGSHVCEGGAELPELTNPAAMSDIRKGFEAINQNGVKFVGTLVEYSGDYEVTPSTYPKSLETSNKITMENIVVKSIPYSEVDNESGGKTLTIGGI